ncbi:MAG: hypothetical protein QOE33_597 [Acidobacteriota bacterium]|nr:hypothetical protein [Acidobacteriota bacterium]
MLYQVGQILLSLAILVAALLLIAVPLAIRDFRAKRRKTAAAFAGRARLDEHTFYRRYFMSRGVPEFIVSQTKKILEDELDADLSRLAPEDDFTKNLSFLFDDYSLSGVYIVERLEKEFYIKISDAEAADAHTFEDIINLVWLKLRRVA